MFVSAYIYSFIPSVVMVEQTTLPFHSKEDFLLTNFTLFGDIPSKKFLSVSFAWSYKQFQRHPGFFQQSLSEIDVAVANRIEVAESVVLRNRFTACRGTRCAALESHTLEGPSPFNRPNCSKTVTVVKRLLEYRLATFFTKPSWNGTERFTHRYLNLP